jgi:hypothetical protein
MATNDLFFTPDRLTQLDQICREIDAGGQTYTIDELNEHFEQKRKSWLDKDAGAQDWQNKLADDESE